MFFLNYIDHNQKERLNGLLSSLTQTSEDNRRSNFTLNDSIEEEQITEDIENDDKLTPDAAKAICINNYLSEFITYDPLVSDHSGRLINPKKPWTPINTDFREDKSQGQSTGEYTSPSNPINLIERTRVWFEQKENSFKQYLNKSLVEYLQAEGLSTSEKDKRGNDVASKISQAFSI